MKFLKILQLLFPKKERLSHDDDLSANFKVKELLHPETEWHHLTKEQQLNIKRLVRRLERLRVLENKAFLINYPGRHNAGFRTRKQNKSVGGAKNSYHLKGMAADIAVPDGSLRSIAIKARDIFGGVILYEHRGFIHLDLRDLEGRKYHPNF